MKYAVTLFSMLLLVVGAMLFVQYEVYSNEELTTKKEFSYTQEIEIVYRENSLDIRQSFTNLPNEEIEVIWPAAAIDSDCFLEKEHSCNRLNDEKTKFKVGENRSQSISYVIPLKDGLQGEKLIEDVFATLKLGNVSYTTLHITTSSNVTGTWITGLPFIGQQQLSLVNYSMFEGTGDVKDLYWMKEKVAFYHKANNYSVYAKQNVTNEQSEKLNNLKLINEEHIVMVQTDKNLMHNGHRIIFVGALEEDTIQYRSAISHLNHSYHFNEVPDWLKQVTASILVNKPFGDKRAIDVFEELKSKLTDAQLSDIQEGIKQLKDSEVTIAKLDEVLSNALEVHTKYFTLNAASKNLYPLVYNDHRAIHINGKEEEELHIIFDEGLVLYPSDALLTKIGYTTSEGPNGYYVTSKDRNFRFPANEYQFYVLNQKRYNISTTPFYEVAGVKYIEESWLHRLFLVDIEKQDDKILLTTTAQQ